jgi:hypothetical protein
VINEKIISLAYNADMRQLRLAAKALGIRIRRSDETGAVCFHAPDGRKLLNWIPETGAAWDEDTQYIFHDWREALDAAHSLSAVVDSVAC